MTDEAKLFETMGELLYVVAMADGVVQKEEKAELKYLLKGHKWASGISWSFQYESAKQNDVNQVYQKALNFCQKYGPSPHYVEFIAAMKMIADASDGIDRQEDAAINSFSTDLISRFQADLEHLIKRNK
jgi:uncharacterized tellurite resistance protein B-like protein